MNQSSRGIASFMAVASLTMLGMAVLALSVLLDLNVSRTRRQVASAQLMQLLQTPVTGGYLDDARLDAWATDVTTAPASIALPAELSHHGATLTLVAGESTQRDLVVVDVFAVLPPWRMQQTLTYRKTPQGWRMADAQLGRLARQADEPPRDGPQPGEPQPE